MGKCKTHLRKYLRRASNKYRTLTGKYKKQSKTQTSSKQPACKSKNSKKSKIHCETSAQVKRKYEKAPLKARHLKSPFKSPLFHPESKSPSVKRLKSARALFTSPTSMKQSKAKSLYVNKRMNVKGEVNENFVTESSTDTLSACEELDLESLPDDNLYENIECFNEENKDILFASKLDMQTLPEDKLIDHIYTQNEASDTKVEIEENQNANKLIALVPTVLDELRKYDGLDSTFVTFFELVANKEFPLDNIAFLLWTEVVKWFSCSSTTKMRYTEKTKLFWKLGWRLFGKRFVNFMGGYKSHGNTVQKMTEPGNYCPDASEINFAVPDVTVLREFDPYVVETERKPGIFNDTISKMSKSLTSKSACITFDGKKIKQGLTIDTGDVDLLGFEKGMTLKDRKDALESETNEVISMIQKVDMYIKEQLESSDGKSELELLNNGEMKQSLMKHLANIAKHGSELEKVMVKREYSKKRLIEISGPDWRKGKYLFAISAITAFIHEIETYMKKARDVSDRICRYIAAMNNEMFINGYYVNLDKEERYTSIEEQRLTIAKDIPESTRLIIQRSEEWSSLRNKAKVTGSTLYKAIGCDGLGKMKDHFEKVICGVSEKEPSAETKAAMDWGTRNEINAVATTVGKILPVFEPGLSFFEEGCITAKGENGEIFLVVSPDGSLRKYCQLESTEVAIEIKCPTRKAHTEFPVRYILQCQAEMKTLDVQRMLYVSWTEQETTVFRLQRNDALFDTAMKLAVDIYGDEKPRKPTKLSDSCKEFMNHLRKHASELEMIGRFVSCKQSKEADTNEYDTTEKTFSNLKELLEQIKECYTQRYDLMREKATEAVVFLLADLDRSWKRNTIRCSPIAWFPKGYSLESEVMRNIAEEVQNRCSKLGVHVPCVSFDGQWHLLVVRSLTGAPLTIFQLQKDVWKEVEKRSKSDILNELKSLNANVVALNYEIRKDEQHRTFTVIATNGGIRLPIYRKRTNNIIHKSNPEDTTAEEATLADMVAEQVRESTDTSEDVLAMSKITDEAELEVFTSNVNEDNWCREIEQLQENSPETATVHKNDNVSSDYHNSSEEVLTVSDLECMMSLLKTTRDSNKKGRWNDVSKEELQIYFSSVENLNKFLDVDLRVIVRYLRKSREMKGTKESDKKAMKVKGIASFIGLSENVPVQTKKLKIVKIRSLKELAFKGVSKYTKLELNVMIAEYKWPEAYMIWKSEVDNITVNGEETEWFYKPEYSSLRAQLEVKCIDSTHLLTRMRRKSCRGGLDMLPNDSWMKVAKHKRTLLTPIMVQECTDPMSVSMAKTHFSESVEHEMRRLGDVDAAELCKDIRNWWQSEDNGGISAEKRIQLRGPLKRRLMSKVNFSRFPPATQHVAGWPQQLWEATIANIDAKAYLYGLAQSGTYNVRAFSSLVGETFFSELTLNDKRGQGTVTARKFGEFISRSTEQLQIRLDPERTFSYCTSKSKVYDTVDETCYDTETTRTYATSSSLVPEFIPLNIQTRDHAFDMPERKRLPGRQKMDHVPMDRNAIQKGSLGVRWEKARTNYSKMLPTKMMGLE